VKGKSGGVHKIFAKQGHCWFDLDFRNTTEASLVSEVGVRTLRGTGEKWAVSKTYANIRKSGM